MERFQSTIETNENIQLFKFIFKMLSAAHPTNRVIQSLVRTIAPGIREESVCMYTYIETTAVKTTNVAEERDHRHKNYASRQGA